MGYTLCCKNRDYRFCLDYPEAAAERLYSWATLELNKERKLRLMQLASLVKSATQTKLAFIQLVGDPATSSQVSGACLAGVFVPSSLLPAICRAYSYG
jgi:hypothetical protein